MVPQLFLKNSSFAETEKGEGMASASAIAANAGLPSAESNAHGTLGEEGDVGEERSRVGSRKTRLGLLFVRSFCIFLEMEWVFCIG